MQITADMITNYCYEFNYQNSLSSNIESSEEIIKEKCVCYRKYSLIFSKTF